MTMEEFLLITYCWVDDEIKALELGRLRPRGFQPKLSDSEVITVELAGEFLGRDKDTEIFSFFRRYHRGEFPALAQVDRTTFVRQAANLWSVKQRLWQRLASRLTELDWLWLVDSLPLPVCQLARAPWCRRFKSARPPTATTT
ncbi:MAG: family transposase [Pedosphaera sp.]|nr:family transposase [Pedosphaera sp.]